MKKIINSTLLVALCSILLFACKKDETNKVTYLSGENPVLAGVSNTSTATVNLDKDFPTRPSLSLNWSNPNFRLSSGISSLDVSYTVEVDTVGSNFSAPAEVVVVSKDLTRDITIKELNKALTAPVAKGGLGLQYGVSHDIEIRVVARLGLGKNPSKYSNVLTFSAVPYFDVLVPLPEDGTLWLVGSAFASSWSNPLPSPYDVTQKFTQESVTKYSIIAHFIGGGGYKVIQRQGVWGTQYHALDGTAFDHGAFERKDADPQFPGPEFAGDYKITLDFVTGEYTQVKQ